MKRTSLILVAVFAMVMLPLAFGQTPQPQDPNAQPSAVPSQETPNAQQPSNSTPTSSSSAASDNHTFVGSIVKSSGKFMLQAGGTNYQLDDQTKAGKFEGKDVKVTGQLDNASNTIRVQAIEPSSSM